MLFVENGYNTCYINSLLVGLFYNSSIIHTKLLDMDPSNKNFIYLQEMVKFNFVDPLRRGISITADVTNEIRNFCFFSGFSKNITKKHNILDYLNFITNNISPLDCTRLCKTISLDESVGNTDIKTLLKTNTDNNILEDTQFMHNMYMIPIYIDRYAHGYKLDTRVDIKRKIMLGNSDYRWNIHCVICYSGTQEKFFSSNSCTEDGTNSSDGHYYVIVPANNKWIFFDDTHIPSFKEIDMGNTLLIDKIMRECVLLIYKII